MSSRFLLSARVTASPQQSHRGTSTVPCRNVISISALCPTSAEELQDAYGRQGLRFSDIAGVFAADLKLENGSSARLLLHGAHITSYKAHMWHGGDEEFLHSVPLRTPKRTLGFVRGGIDLRFFDCKDPLKSILPSSLECWCVQNVASEPSSHVQVTLANSSNTEHAVKNSLHFRYVVTLTENSLSSALVVSNPGLSPVEFTGSMRTHLSVSEVEGAFAVGLKGRSYRYLPSQSFEKPSLMSQIKSKIWGPKLIGDSLQKQNPQDTDSIQEAEQEWLWTTQNEDYFQCHGGMDILYPSPPTRFSLMDRGFRRSVFLQRHGFEELCLSNPGLDSKLPDWSNFICMGPAQTSQPVRLEQNEEWRGAQTLVNSGSL